jgi:hypothetical protein
MELTPAPVRREWMTGMRDGFAQRCLPLLLANQAGWELRNPTPLSATWDGGDGLEALSVEPLVETALVPASSHFGYGILTWTIPYLFRTSPSFNLLVRGPVNRPKDGAAPLEGLVETDWSPATFTMNWKLTRPGLTVRFEQDEPIAMIVPMRRGELEAFDTRRTALDDHPDEGDGYRKWRQDREAFLYTLRNADREAVGRGWQGDYFRGTLGSPPASAGRHQTRVRLESFE